MKNDWIDSTQKLPKEGREVLIKCEKDGCLPVFVVASWNEGKGMWKIQKPDLSGREVTAWMDFEK